MHNRLYRNGLVIMRGTAGADVRRKVESMMEVSIYRISRKHKEFKGAQFVCYSGKHVY